jgi:hypothetical protein
MRNPIRFPSVLLFGAMILTQSLTLQADPASEQIDKTQKNVSHPVMSHSQGNKLMPTLLETLHSISANDLKALETIADTIRIKGYTETREVVEIVNGSDEKMAHKGRLILGFLNGLSIEPQIENIGKANPLLYAESLQRLLDAQNEIRGLLAHELVSALDDKRELPPPQLLGKAEGRRPKKRVCDQAYLQLRKFLLIDDSIEKQSHQERLFWDLNEKSREIEIAKFKHTKAFTQLEDLYPGE